MGVNNPVISKVSVVENIHIFNDRIGASFTLLLGHHLVMLGIAVYLNPHLATIRIAV